MDSKLIVALEILALDHAELIACLSDETFQFEYHYPDHDDMPSFENEHFPSRCLLSLTQYLVSQNLSAEGDPNWKEVSAALFALLYFILVPSEWEYHWRIDRKSKAVFGPRDSAWDGCTYLARCALDSLKVKRRFSVSTDEFIGLLKDSDFKINVDQGRYEPAT